MITIPRVHTDNIHQQAANPSSSVSSPFNTAMQRALCEIYGAKAAEVTVPPSPLSPATIFCNKIVGRTYLIVDNSNILLGGCDGGFRIDYGTPVLTFLGGDRIVSASIVVSQPLGAQRQNQMLFYGHLQQLGWRVYRHLALQKNIGELSENETLVDGDVRTNIRAAADAPDCDSIVLMSGDGGMTSAVLYAQRAGKKVFVLAWDGTLHPALAAAATGYMSIDELRPLIARVLH